MIEDVAPLSIALKGIVGESVLKRLRTMEVRLTYLEQTYEPMGFPVIDTTKEDAKPPRSVRDSLGLRAP